MSDYPQRPTLSAAGSQPTAFCICIPARNEADRLPVLLESIAHQLWPGPINVSIAINNTTDDSLEIIEATRTCYRDRLNIHVAVADFPAELAHAGSARRLAMSEGLALLAGCDDAVLLSTDADVRPPVDWMQNIAAAFARGADLVGGKIVIDQEREPLPQPVLRLREAWDSYWTRVRAIEDSIDPVPWDPAPRHGDHTGASLAIRAGLYRACGGVPTVPTGEDLALVQAAVAMGGRLAHPADIWVRVSPRIAGRADGGMAAAMAELFQASGDGAVPMAPAFNRWAARAAWRRAMRQRPDGQAHIARHEPFLPAMPHDMQLEVAPCTAV